MPNKLTANSTMVVVATRAGWNSKSRYVAMYQKPTKLPSQRKSGRPTKVNMRWPMRWATFSGMAAAASSCARWSCCCNCRIFWSSASRCCAFCRRISARAFWPAFKSGTGGGTVLLTGTDVCCGGGVETAGVLLFSLLGSFLGSTGVPNPLPALNGCTTKVLLDVRRFCVENPWHDARIIMAMAILLLAMVIVICLLLKLSGSLFVYLYGSLRSTRAISRAQNGER
mmetsp:Transcript_451/g.1269  ORF Transcript_451/g.1269 Transcript_451/m.1269 type:complete len:226 (-) Transcript_451:42-719(-)